MRCALLMMTIPCLLPVLPNTSPAQENIISSQDSLPRFTTETIVVTADRMENKIANSTASISALRSEDIRRLPVGRFSDVFNFVPGFSVVQMDGMGRNPIINARGFYGGGEAEYNVVLLDGMQINDLETGLVNWNLVPLHAIENVEIARGASSPLYGDAALGSVINIITRRDDFQRTSLNLQGGSYGIADANLHTRGGFGSNSYQALISNERTHGFRDHSKWHATNFGGDLLIPTNDHSTVRFSTMNQWVKSDDPGPLTEQELMVDRSSSSVYYRNDNKNERRHQFHASYKLGLSDVATLNAGAFYRFKGGTAQRTFTNPAVIIDPQTFAVIGFYDTTLYGDTKERDFSTNQFAANIQVNHTDNLGGLPNRLVAGLEGEYGRLASKYYSAFAGFEQDYAQTGASRGTLVSDGRNSRMKYAAYVNNELRIIDPLAVSIGARFDGISDKYTGNFPDTTLKADHTAFSPKVGVNIRYFDDVDFAGNVYANVNRSFKAPTLDQISEQRPIEAGFFIPTGPNSYFFTSQAVSPISNSSLKPQKGTSYEVGVYQRLRYLSHSYGELMLSAYQIDMKDEIDFDIATFKYQNINESRHRGIESGLWLYWLPNVMTFFNYTWTGAKFRSGPNEGKYLKSIPRNIAGLGITYEHTSGVKASIGWNFVSNMFLDDENTVRLPDYHTGSVRLSYSVPHVSLFVDMENLLDKKFSTTGYALFGTTYLFPSAGRVVRGGIGVEL